MPPQAPLPFTPCGAIDIDLCVVGVDLAIGVWIANFDTQPSVLWVPPRDLMQAERICVAGGFRLVALADPSYEIDWWSVGTRLDRGFGSKGA